MNSELVTSFWMNIASTAVWTVFLSFIGLAIYQLFLKRNEAQWIQKHGLMLLVYFRNVDWRCERVRNLIVDSSKSRLAAVTDLKRELPKLCADLAALERYVAMWDRRLASIPLWYPYAKMMRRVSECNVELNVALSRHVSPLLNSLRTADNDGLSGDPPVDSDYGDYLAYFKGGQDRMWGKSKSGSCSQINELRGIGLKERLGAMLEALQTIFEKAGGMEIEKVRIWGGDEDPLRIWYKD